MSICVVVDSVGSGFNVMCDVAAGAAGASVAGVTGVVDFTARVEGKGVDVVGTTLLVMGP